MSQEHDHGGNIDAAVAQYGGRRAEWLDLSTGINLRPYPLPDIPAHFWHALPDSAAQSALIDAARSFWDVPAGIGILPAPGVSVLIAVLPRLAARATVRIEPLTYNEHAAAFRAAYWSVRTGGQTLGQVVVNPNNPCGRLWTADEVMAAHRVLTIVDESFCDVCPEASLVALAHRPGVVVLKGLGKFWGLAGIRLGFALARPQTVVRLAEMLGPWAVSGPAQHIGAAALRNHDWAATTRTRLQADANRLDRLMAPVARGKPCGTSLFRLYDVGDAATLHDRLARHKIWTRVFPWSGSALRLGLPGTDADRTRLGKALKSG
ncbi:MAG: pyridoxal phosphate-dependent class II aminotransferase [Rhodobacteraceae bacterium]|nr:pyridoxal phosphate-dependent class II aminotransferase [Paracoccaceae bacterium]